MTTLVLILSWIAAAVAVVVSIVLYRRHKTARAEIAAMQARLEECATQVQRLQHVSSQEDKKKFRFIASAAHDLRQPLHALALFSDALLNTPLEPSARDIAGKIKRSVNSLVEKSNAVFDISKLETGSKEAKIREFPLQEVFQSLDAEYGAQAEVKGLRWHCDVSRFSVRSDPVLLETILRNLLSNAVRYTQQGGISLRSNHDNGLVYISITDTGVGIPWQRQEQIFQEFLQPDNSSLTHGAVPKLGLGLSIVSRLTKLLGHRIDIQSEMGKGTTFTLSVTEGAQSLAGTETPSKPPETNDLEGLKVLVIDDDPQVRDGIQSLLQTWQCRLTLAENEDEVHDLLVTQGVTPDVIISDYHLGKRVDGVRVLDSILPQAGLRVPVLFVTSDHSADVLEAIKTRGYSFMNKPVAPVQLRAFLRAVARSVALRGQETPSTTNAGQEPAGETTADTKIAEIASELKAKPLALALLLTEIANEYRAKAAAKGIEFTCDCESQIVTSDPQLLEALLKNLLNFALRRTSQGGASIRCEVTDQGTQINIIDSGKPLSAKTVGLIKRYQSDPDTEKEPTFNKSLMQAFQLARTLGHQIRLGENNANGLTLQVLIPSVYSQ